MARINLLPWREELRRERQRQFLLSLLITAVLGVILVFLVGMVYDEKIRHQNTRNQLLQTEIHKLELRITKINELERTRARLLSRKRIIEQLQASRSTTVELLDQLAKSIPVGVTLVSVSQQGSNLSLTGTSQSNARVSAYLQSLEQNSLFLNPQLIYVRSAVKSNSREGQNKGEPYQFSIKCTLRPPITTDEEAEEAVDQTQTAAGGKSKGGATK